MSQQTSLVHMLGMRDIETHPPEAQVEKQRFRNTVPIAETERIRLRLGMSEHEFSIALGYKTYNSYGDAKSTGEIIKTYLLAAQWLLHERLPDTRHYLLTYANGDMHVVEINDTLQEMTLNGTNYVLVPK